MTATTLNQSPVVVQTFMGALYSSQYYAADNGAVNAISIPLAIAPNAYAEGVIWFTKFAQTNTSQTVTAKVGSLAALPVVIDQAGTLPVVGSIIQNMFGMLCYSAAQNKLILLNPQTATGSFMLTFTTSYFTVQQTGTVNYKVGPDGKTARIIHPNISGTSNATTLIGTGVPAVLTSSFTSFVPIWVVNSGSQVMGVVEGMNTTSWSYFVGVSGAFANTGTKGAAGIADFSYSL